MGSDGLALDVPVARSSALDHTGSGWRLTGTQEEGDTDGRQHFLPQLPEAELEDGTMEGRGPELVPGATGGQARTPEHLIRTQIESLPLPQPVLAQGNEDLDGNSCPRILTPGNAGNRRTRPRTKCRRLFRAKGESSGSPLPELVISASRHGSEAARESSQLAASSPPEQSPDTAAVS